MIYLCLCKGWCDLRYGTPTQTTGECICKPSSICQGPRCEQAQGFIWYAYTQCPTCQCVPKEKGKDKELDGNARQKSQAVDSTINNANVKGNANSNANSNTNGGVDGYIIKKSKSGQTIKQARSANHESMLHQNNHENNGNIDEQPILPWYQENFDVLMVLLFCGVLLVMLITVLVFGGRDDHGTTARGENNNVSKGPAKDDSAGTTGSSNGNGSDGISSACAAKDD